MDLDINQYIGVFVEEAKEHLQNMNDVLLELEKNSSNLEYVNEIFRVAHTIKGMSATMGFSNMANLTHEMENVLHAARSNEIKLSENVIDILFECFDALDDSVSSIIDKGVESSDTHDSLIYKLSLVLADGKELQSSEDTSNAEYKFNEYATDIIDTAINKGLNAYNIDIRLSESCMLKSARAFIIFNTLESMGEIIYSNPSAEDIEDEKFDLVFSIVLVTEVSKESLLNELNQISEVDTITVDLIKKSIEKEYMEVQEKVEDSTIENHKTSGQENEKSDKNQQNHSGKVGKTVRVDIDRLDNLMNLVSELIITKTRMDDLSENSKGENMSEAIEYLERITTNLHDAVMKVRMVPIERVFNRFPRMVRDLAKELNKEINLQMSGEDTEVDRTVIDEIGDPLIHLLRNSIDHGIELPSERLDHGKPEEGNVILKAYPDGNNVVVEVEDDGKGVDYEKVKNKAIQKGIISEKESENLTNDDIVNLLFNAGFSTSDQISDISGRGVGLDVVKSKIESINGTIEVKSIPYKGTKFIIRIPLTLAIIQALLVNLDEEIYAIPLSSITEITNIDRNQIRDIQGQEVVLYRGITLPIIKLNEILQTKSTKEKRESDDLVVVVVRKGDKQAGLIVDNLLGQQEIVIKSLGKYLSYVKYLSGATILGNGNISLILDINSLI